MISWIDNGLTKLRNWWYPTSEKHPSPDYEEWPREKLRSGPVTPFPAFLPYFDTLQTLGESAEMRLSYRRMLADPHVKAAVLGKIVAVMGLELKVVPHNKNNVRDQLIAEFVQWSLTERLDGGVPGMVWSLLSGALVDGFSVSEKVWEREEEGQWRNKDVLAQLKPKDVNQDLVAVQDAYKNLISFRGLRYNAGEEFNPEDFVVVTFLPLYGNVVGMSDLRATYRSAWFLNTVETLRAVMADKRSLPVVAGSYKSPDKAQALMNALGLMKSSNWIAIPEEVKLQVLDIAGRGEDVFKSFRADLVEQVFLSIQGATLQALAGQSGVNVGRSTIHKGTSDLFKWVLSMYVLEAMNNHKRGLIRDIVTRNFTGVMAWPKASFGGLDAGASKEDLEIDTGLHALGYDQDTDEMNERYGRKLVKQQQQPAMPGAMPGMGGGDPFAAPPVGAEPDAEGFGDDGWRELPEGLLEDAA
jgi:hypothetical protein